MWVNGPSWRILEAANGFQFQLELWNLCAVQAMLCWVAQSCPAELSFFPANPHPEMKKVLRQQHLEYLNILQFLNWLMAALRTNRQKKHKNPSKFITHTSHPAPQVKFKSILAALFMLTYI